MNTTNTNEVPEAPSDDASTQDKASTWLEPFDTVGTAVASDAVEGLASAAEAVADGLGDAFEVVASILGGLLELGS